MAGKKTKKSKKKTARSTRAAPVKKKAVAARKSTKKKSAKKTISRGTSSRKPTKKKTVKKTAGKAVKKTSKKTAKKSAKKSVTAKKKKSVKRVAHKAAKKVVKRVAKKAVKKSVKKSVKKVAKKAVSKIKRKTARAATAVAAPASPLDTFAARESLPPPVTPLSDKDLQMFRDLLLSKRAEIAGDVSTLENQALSDNRQDAAGDLSSMPIHMADIGTDNYEKEFTLGLLESERHILREIDEAIRRIDKRTYGVCEATGRAIGKTRLRAQPWVRFCYEYVLAQERGTQGGRW